jgi:hypothetical protein
VSRLDLLADPKAIGEDIEALVVDTIDGLAAAADPDDWYDAVATTVIGPRTAPEALIFGSILVVEADTRIEIKACKRRVSNGDRDRPGNWLFQIDQHEQLLADNAIYLLAVYEETGGAKHLDTMLAVPASILDEILVEQWYDVDRHEGQVAQLPWPHVLGAEVSGDAE